MKTEQEIQKRLQQFRDYEDYVGKEASKLGILAAVQRGYLYAQGTDPAKIKKFWADLLVKHGQNYAKPGIHMQQFLDDIEEIKNSMNYEFKGCFANSRPDYDNEFRLAHAQKSLSIYLKHLWARGELNGQEPPFGPIDGVILKKYLKNDDPWTRINSLDDREIQGKTIHGYNYYRSLMQEAADRAGESAAVWELFKWTPNNKKKTEKGKSAKQSAENSCSLMVYNKEGHKNYGKTFQIINNKATLPHDTDSVYVEYNGRHYEATLGSYRNKGNTLRGKDGIKQLIEDNHWIPGQEFQVEFKTDENGGHIYRIIQ